MWTFTSKLNPFITALFCLIPFATAPYLTAQANFTAQLRGVVKDESGGIVPGAKVAIENEATGVATTVVTDGSGRYAFAALKPATYRITVEATGFAKLVQSGVTLRVSQQSSLDLQLKIGSTTSSVDVKANAVLLNSDNGELGQEITSRYITEMPLFNRQVEKLAFLAPGVTESQGYATDQTNENFVSNGQRNSSAEMRLDGSILSVPEAGEGAMFWSHYQPSIEIIDEFKVQTNGFSAEYGSNGGTVVNIISKSGTNELHGSGYWFGQRAAMNANDFFANRAGEAKPDYARDQFGGTVGGPIVKNKMFYFFNYDQTRFNQPYTLTTTVPTAAQMQGDFSQTFNQDGSLQQIYNPASAMNRLDPEGQPDVVRAAFANNRIPQSQFNPIAVKILSLYPSPTGAGDANTGFNNFTKNYLLGQPAHQYNLKVDEILNEKNKLSGRFSKGYLRRQSPEDFQGAVGQGDERNDYYNGVLEYTFTPTPTFIWTTRLGVDRHHQTRYPDNNVDPVSVGFPSILETANGSNVFPEIDVQNYQTMGLTGYTQTIEAQTQFVLDSTASKVIGAHNVQFGGESRILLSNFFQPPHPSGQFSFSQGQTMQYSLDPNSAQGNGIASLLTGWAGGGDLSIHPSVAEKSRETSFFIQDDWKVTDRLTLNLGLRYEFSTPYQDRYNRLQIANFTADTGVSVPGVGEIRGIDQFSAYGKQHANTDWNNFGPRLGVAFQLNPKTVIRGGAGIYYGVNYATSYQDLGPAYRKDLNYYSSLDNGLTPFATLENPFPYGNVAAQGTKYGNLNGWGFPSGSNQSNTFRNAEIYQWAASVQRELPGSQVIELAYSANRSTHLPDAYVRNRNFVSTALREQYGTSGLYAYVNNPFYPYFVGPNAIFNEPDSLYSQPTIQQINLLRPYPQFPGGYEGFAEFVANSWYNSLQVKYEKRYSKGLNIIASYTFAHQTDDSSASSNGWLGNSPSLQDPNNLRGEYSVAATDAVHRLVFSATYELPFGRGKLIGANWGHLANAVAGGWQVNGYLTLQSGLPLNVYMSNGRLADGSQRPDVSGDPRSQYSIKDVVNGQGADNYFNVASFSDPGDQIAGNEPRFSDVLRGDGIRDLDCSLFKNFSFRERYRVQLRAEFFNFTNTARFRDPDTGFGDNSFGTISSQVNQPRQVQMGARFTF